MNHPSDFPSDFPSGCVYSVKLLATDPLHPGRLAGRLEHVLSGRRHDFVDGPGLLACLAHEQRRAALVAAHHLAARPGLKP